jgi:hypothetical protein
VIDEEQVWIAKYRATLGATPIKESRLEAFAARLNGMIQELVSAIGKASHKKKSAQSDVKRFEESCPRIAQATVSESNPQSQSKLASVRSPGKQHPVGQPRRRRAS